MTPEIDKALCHVRQFFPDVCIVAFNTDGQWIYMTENFDTPNFDNVEIAISILEAAADSISELPAIFQR